MALSHYNIISRIFKYPFKGFREDVRDCYEVLVEKYPAAAVEFSHFFSWVERNDDNRVEELFTKTFDVQPVTYLDIGYVLFVEDYKRGEFLVNMKVEQDRAGNDYGSDLPDNLVHVLTLLPKLTDECFKDELVIRALLPAIRKMLEEFAEARVELKLRVIKKMHKALIDEDLNRGNVYRSALLALQSVLETDFRLAHASFPENSEMLSLPVNNFLKQNNNVSNTPTL